uniref:Major facilitator superfamily (MFS) profile domain-containing protein n=1 Tax=Megaselia scalaris TaxID=36166 RepID=T1GM22_MEGSC
FPECKNGYDYDRTWYKETIPSYEDWVCEKDLYMTNTFVVSRILELIGAFVLGQLGDSHGRQKVFFFSVVATSLGRILSIMLTSNFLWFAIGVGISG